MQSYLRLYSKSSISCIIRQLSEEWDAYCKSHKTLLYRNNIVLQIEDHGHPLFCPCSIDHVIIFFPCICDPLFNKLEFSYAGHFLGDVRERENLESLTKKLEKVEKEIWVTVWFFLGRGKWSVPSPFFPCLPIPGSKLTLMVGKSIYLVLLSVMCAIFSKTLLPIYTPPLPSYSKAIESGWVWWSSWQTLIEIWDTMCSPFPKIFHQPHGMSQDPMFPCKACRESSPELLKL